jgi:N-dimethylarginine dimethylaminohydrolase
VSEQIAVVGSDVPGMPPLPPVYEEEIRRKQEQLRSGAFTLEQMPGYVPGQPPNPDVWHDIDALEIYPKVWGRECGKNGIGRLREVVLTEITEYEKFAYYDLDPAYFPQMADDYHSIDVARMRDQSQQYQAVLEEHGVEVHRIRFPEPHVSAFGPGKSNWGAAELFVLRGGFVLPKRGVNPFGTGRAEYMALWAWTQLGIPPLYTIHGKGVFEAGPCFFLAEDVFVTGRGMAHNQDGIDQMVPVVARSAGLAEDELTTLVIDFPGRRYYDPTVGTSHHPDLVLGPLDARTVIAYTPGLDYPTYQWLRHRGYTIIDVEPEEHIRFCPANVMLIEPGLVVMHAEATGAIAAVRAAGIEVIPTPYSEFLKEAGGLHCSTGQILRDKGPYSTDRP